MLGPDEGSIDGELLGPKLGCTDGINEGDELGSPLGSDEGDELGALLGVDDGLLDGDELGPEDGTPLGTSLGSRLILGSKDGSDDGIVLGLPVARPRFETKESVALVKFPQFMSASVNDVTLGHWISFSCLRTDASLISSLKGKGFKIAISSKIRRLRRPFVGKLLVSGSSGSSVGHRPTHIIAIVKVMLAYLSTLLRSVQIPGSEKLFNSDLSTTMPSPQP